MTAFMHSIEWQMGFQYAHVHRLALASEPHLPDEPPDGKGWRVNGQVGKRGHLVRVPAWSDGEIVQQITYWLREKPGQMPYVIGAHISVDRRPWWIGSKIPERILAP